MSKPKVFEKPTGLKDYLPEVVARLRKIEANVLNCMDQWGYRQIITPTLEFYDTVGAASSTSDRKLFKLLDQQGRTLVLRSELTAPIARVASSLLKDKPLPLRLSYHSNVFRAFEQEAGRESEFFQTGVELVGDESSEADAEVIALAIASLQAAGISSFKIALGHVGYLNGLLNQALGEREHEQQMLKECLLRRDHVGYRQLLRQLQLDVETKAALESILRLRGGEEICTQAKAVTNDPVAQAAVEHLCLIWDVLKDYGVSHHVLIDLTMIGDFSYYTGMTFEGYSADLAFPVCSGGRYDNLLAQFGRPAPATGFALKTDRILDVVAKEPFSEPQRILIGYRPEYRKQALQHAAELRSARQCSVETKLFASDEQKNEHIQMNEDGSCSYLGVLYNEWIDYR